MNPNDIIPNTEQKFGTNKLAYYANEYIDNPLKTSELSNINMTQEFFDELEKMIENKELVNITINGQVRMGKSTIALALGAWLKKILYKHNQSKNDTFGIKNIARDDQELLVMTQTSINNEVLVVDEYNALEATGENVTAEKAAKEHFSQVQASRYIHRIQCAPFTIYDTTSDIILEVIANDRNTYTNHCKLYYVVRNPTIGSYNQLLGYVNIYVGHLLHNWIENGEKLIKDETKQKEMALLCQEDWYCHYMYRKERQFELINK